MIFLNLSINCSQMGTYQLLRNNWFRENVTRKVKPFLHRDHFQCLPISILICAWHHQGQFSVSDIKKKTYADVQFIFLTFYTWYEWLLAQECDQLVIHVFCVKIFTIHVRTFYVIHSSLTSIGVSYSVDGWGEEKREKSEEVEDRECSGSIVWREKKEEEQVS